MISGPNKIGSNHGFLIERNRFKGNYHILSSVAGSGSISSLSRCVLLLIDDNITGLVPELLNNLFVCLQIYRLVSRFVFPSAYAIFDFDSRSNNLD